VASADPQKIVLLALKDSEAHQMEVDGGDTYLRLRRRRRALLQETNLAHARPKARMPRGSPPLAAQQRSSFPGSASGLDRFSIDNVIVPCAFNVQFEMPAWRLAEDVKTPSFRALPEERRDDSEANHVHTGHPSTLSGNRQHEEGSDESDLEEDTADEAYSRRHAESERREKAMYAAWSERRNGRAQSNKQERLESRDLHRIQGRGNLDEKVGGNDRMVTHLGRRQRGQESNVPTRSQHDSLFAPVAAQELSNEGTSSVSKESGVQSEQHTAPVDHIANECPAKMAPDKSGLGQASPRNETGMLDDRHSSVSTKPVLPSPFANVRKGTSKFSVSFAPYSDFGPQRTFSGGRAQSTEDGQGGGDQSDYRQVSYLSAHPSAVVVDESDDDVCSSGESSVAAGSELRPFGAPPSPCAFSTSVTTDGKEFNLLMQLDQ
jgi:hypothetical protein